MTGNKHIPSNKDYQQSNAPHSPTFNQDKDERPIINTVSAFALFNYSTEAVKRNLNTFVLLLVVPALFSIVAQMFEYGQAPQQNLFAAQVANPNAAMFGLFGFILTLLFTPAITIASVRASRGEEVSFKEALSQSWPIFLKFYGLIILIGLTIVFGLILFIVPGLIAVQRLLLAPYFMIDQNLGIIESIKRSNETSKGYFIPILGIVGVSILLALPSLVPLAGNFVATILAMLYACAPALRYLEIVKGKQLTTTTS